MMGLLTLLSSLSWGASPTLSGLYRADELGLLLFVTQDGRASGKYHSGGDCLFQGDQQIVEGQFEGNLIAGTVMLCQSGAACGQKVYPFLGFYDPSEGTLTADIKLDAGCSSPALVGNRLLFRQVSPEEKAGAAKAGFRKKVSSKKNLELHRRALLEARRLLETGDYSQAAQQFELGISYHEQNWAAYFLLGVAEFKRGNVLKAIDSYERARELARQSRQEFPDIHYNLACAHSRRGDKRAALAERLKKAVSLGFDQPEQMGTDLDLNKLLGDDPEFKRLIDQSWTLKAKQPNGGKP